MTDGSPPAVQVEVAVPAATVDELTGRLWVDAPGVLGIQEPEGDGPLLVWIEPDALPAVRAVVDAVLGDAAGFVALPVEDLPATLAVEVVELPDGLGPVELELDAQRVFGRGDHPTTRMALDALVTSVRPGQRVLDLGTGSGVLAIAAARAGAATVVATDIDPVAVETARRNAERNGVAAVVEVSAAELADLRAGERFDLVVANLSAATIVSLAGDLDALAEPGGLLLTGVLADQADAVTAALPRVGAVAESGGWVLLRG